MKHSIVFLPIFFLAIASCSPRDNGPMGTPAITAKLEETNSPFSFTPTQTPETTTLNGRATLYSGPGNANYESVAELPDRTSIITLGTFGEFVKVSVVPPPGEPAELTGFVWKKFVSAVSLSSLPALTRDQVPWEPFFLPTCSSGEYDSKTNQVTFASVGGDVGYYTLSAEWAVTAPIRIQIGSLKTRDNGDSEIWNNNDWSGIKIIGGTQLLIRAKADNGKFEITIPNPGGGYPYVLYEGGNSSRPIQLIFDKPADGKPIGTSFSVLEGTGGETTVDLTATGEWNLPGGLFPNGKLFFGTDTMPDASMTVTGFTIGSQPKGEWVERAETDPEGLFRLAEARRVTIGSDFMFTRAIDRRYCQTMQHDFNLAILGDFSWEGFWVGPGVYNWSAVDRVVDFAVKQRWHVRASHLVWGDLNSIPKWLKTESEDSDEERGKEYYTALLVNHINAVADHFQGKVHEWSVANEAVEMNYCSNAIGQIDFWNSKIGPEYVRLAFETARAAVPKGDILIFNSAYDHPFAPHLHCEEITLKKMRETVRDLNSKFLETGNPDDKLVDVVGMEMHYFNGLSPEKDCIIQIMRDFAKLGVRVYITEMEFNLDPLTAVYPGQADRWEYEACVYREMMEACMESGVCDSFGMWGISDAISYLTDPGQRNLPNSDPLLFDKYFLPKPAYFAVRDALIGENATRCEVGQPAPKMCPT
jgi:endo-1,4-beta-xylanase